MECKKVSIINPTEMSNVLNKKDEKMRIQTHTWNINDCELSHEIQLNILNFVHENINNETINNEYVTIFINNLKNKISGYKQQDILKKKLDLDKFINLKSVISLLHESLLKCCYCHEDIYILYKKVREMSQWTLDRINNDQGHDVGNLVISCLKCNLKRRRINKNSFMMTKNMIVKKENGDFEAIRVEDNKFKFDETQTRIIRIKEKEKEKEQEKENIN